MAFPRSRPLLAALLTSTTALGAAGAVDTSIAAAAAKPASKGTSKAACATKAAKRTKRCAVKAAEPRSGVPAHASAAGFYFTEGFENRRLSAWSQVAGSPTIQSSVRRSGTYALRTPRVGYANAIVKDFAQSEQVQLSFCFRQESGGYQPLAVFGANDAAIMHDGSSSLFLVANGNWTRIGSFSGVSHRWHCPVVKLDAAADTLTISVDGQSQGVYRRTLKAENRVSVGDVGNTYVSGPYFFDDIAVNASGSASTTTPAPTTPAPTPAPTTPAPTPTPAPTATPTPTPPAPTPTPAPTATPTPTPPAPTPTPAPTATPTPAPDLGGTGLTAGNSLTMLAGREFLGSSYVHQPLPTSTPVDPKSAAMVGDLQRQIRQYYNTASVNIHNYAPPIYTVSADQPTVRVRAFSRDDAAWAHAGLQEKWANVPLPSNFQASPGTDQEAVVYQPSTGKYWEFWQMAKTGGRTTNSTGQPVDEWGARWGGRIDNLSSNPGYFNDASTVWNTWNGTKYGTTATGLPLMAGTMTIEEQQRGVVNHSVHFAIPEASKDWAFPAQRTDGQLDPAQFPNAIPEGATFRLPSDLNLEAMDMDPYARMIARAVQKYGMVLRDRSGSVVFYGENPANRYAEDPYTKAGGILGCPNGVSAWSCAPDSNNRLRGFPWDKLQVLKLTMNR